MPASDTLEQELLDLIFLNLSFDNIGDATGIIKSTGDGNFTVALSTGTLTDSSDQATTEAAYTSYVRKSVARGAAQWTVTSGTVTNDNAITFAQATGGSETETDFSLGSDQVADEMWIYGALTASLAVSNGITPEFAAGDLDVSLT